MANKINKRYQFKERKFVKETIVSLLFFLLIASCGSSDHLKVASRNGNSKGTFHSLAVINRFASGLNVETARGEDLYLQKCSVCHGNSGDGKGFNAYNLKSNFGVEPFNFKVSEDNALLLSRNEVKKATTYGGLAVNKSQYMPPWGNTFIAYDIDCITIYVWSTLMGQKTK